MATGQANLKHFSASSELIERAKQEREMLLRLVAESYKTIDRSREIIAKIDEVLAQVENHSPKK